MSALGKHPRDEGDDESVASEPEKAPVTKKTRGSMVRKVFKVYGSTKVLSRIPMVCIGGVA